MKSIVLLLSNPRYYLFLNGFDTILTQILDIQHRNSRYGCINKIYKNKEKIKDRRNILHSSWKKGWYKLTLRTLRHSNIPNTQTLMLNFWSTQMKTKKCDVPSTTNLPLYSENTIIMGVYQDDKIKEESTWILSYFIWAVILW